MQHTQREGENKLCLCDTFFLINLTASTRTVFAWMWPWTASQGSAPRDATQRLHNVAKAVMLISSSLIAREIGDKAMSVDWLPVTVIYERRTL